MKLPLQFNYGKATFLDGRTSELDAITESKFTAWDDIVQQNLMVEGTEEEKATIFGLLTDPTIYAYAWFRNEQGHPLRLYSYQDVVINDPNRRVMFAAANQIGKTVALCVKAVHFMILNPGTTTIVVSKTLPLSKDILRRIRWLLNNGILEYKYDIGDTETKTEIYLRQYEDFLDPETQQPATRELEQSRIICVPATEGALSYSAHLLLPDEIAFYENGDYIFKQILQPRTYTTKGQIIEFSNPNGQQGVYWEHWNNKRFSKYRFTFLDKPGNTKEEFDELCEDLTQQEIDSTLMAIFTSPMGGFMSYEERKAMQEERPSQLPTIVDEPLYLFFDFAKTVDRTVRAAGVPIGPYADPEGVYVHELKEYPHGTPYTEILDDLDRLIQTIGRTKIAMIGWDNSGVGGGIEDFIKRLQLLGIPCMPVDFSLENKSRIYTMFKLLVERNLRVIGDERRRGIKIPFLRDCDKQLAQLRFTKTSRDYLKVHHEKESDRDDYPDALAGLCSLIIRPENAPISATIIGDDDHPAISEGDEDEELKRFGVPLGAF